MKETPGLAAGPAVRLGPDIKVRVGQQLRVIYGDVMVQGMPERCAELIKRLDDLQKATGE